MDIATVVGVVAGVVLVSLAIITGGSPHIFFDFPSVLIVLGGTTATTLIRFPLHRVVKTFEVIKNAFSHSLATPDEVIKELVEISRRARTQGMLSLDGYKTKDRFLEQGVQLVVDGNEFSTVEDILTTDIKYLRQRHRDGQEILKAVGDAAPAFGMIGTLIGLVVMLTHMDDVKTLGPAMATAILTTFYGALIANIIALPIAKKLEIRSREEGLNRELMTVGLLHILKGENPRMMEMALRAFLSRKVQEEPAQKPRKVRAA